MKKRISILLSCALLLACISPVSALAANETSGSTEVSTEIPWLDDTEPGGTEPEPPEPSYSYVVNIPTSFSLTKENDSFSITCSELNISPEQWVRVCIDDGATFADDGNFYLYLNGDKASEDWIFCNIYRVNKVGMSSAAMGPEPLVATFEQGSLEPSNWGTIQIEPIFYDDAELTAGTYSGTIHYTITLE